MNEELSAFGERLRATREELDLTLKEVEQATKIRKRFLEDFESGRTDPSLSVPQVRGFLRNYARVLRLDPDQVIADYEAARQARPSSGLFSLPFKRAGKTHIPEPEAPPAASKPVIAPAISATNIPDDTPAWRQIVRVMLYVMLVAVMIGMIAAGVYIILEQSNQDEQAQQAANPPLITDPASQPVDDFIPPTPTLTPTAAPAQSGIEMPPVIPNTGQGLAVFINATARSWVEVTVDGVVQYRTILKPGTALQYQATESVKILTSNAGGLEVSINGTPLGSLGGIGERYERTFTTADLEAPTSMPLPSPTLSAPENGADLFTAAPLPTLESAAPFESTLEGTSESAGSPSGLVTVAPTPIPAFATFSPPTPTPTITLTPSITPTPTFDLPDRVTRTPRP